MPWEYGEGNYAVRCGLSVEQGGGGLSTALPHWAGDACSPQDDAAAAAEKEGSGPGGDEERHCHSVFVELRPKTARGLSDYRWFLWGTALHPDNATAREL